MARLRYHLDVGARGQSVPDAPPLDPTATIAAPAIAVRMVSKPMSARVPVMSERPKYPWKSKSTPPHTRRPMMAPTFRPSATEAAPDLWMSRGVEQGQEKRSNDPRTHQRGLEGHGRHGVPREEVDHEHVPEQVAECKKHEATDQGPCRESLRIH